MSVIGGADHIELHPVNASMVELPVDYRWSSYGVNAGLRPRQQLVAHEVYQRLGLDNMARHHTYRELFSMSLDKAIVHDIERASIFSISLGDSRFKEQVETVLN